MRALNFIISASLVVLLGACSSYDRSFIQEVSDIPLKTTQIPGTDWASSPLRSHAKYVLFGAESQREMQNCVGDYYFVTWYDAEPTKPVRVVMRYTQAASGSAVQMTEKTYPAPRKTAASHTERFFFTGDERSKKGDVLTWRMELYVDGKQVDSKQSYLWE